MFAPPLKTKGVTTTAPVVGLIFKGFPVDAPIGEAALKETEVTVPPAGVTHERPAPFQLNT